MSFPLTKSKFVGYCLECWPDRLSQADLVIYIDAIDDGGEIRVSTKEINEPGTLATIGLGVLAGLIANAITAGFAKWKQRSREERLKEVDAKPTEENIQIVIFVESKQSELE